MSTTSDFVGFHHACFPHLLSSVIDNADYATLLALRQTSSTVGAEVDRRLFRHALVQRPAWPPAASPLFVGNGDLNPATGSSSKLSLPIPAGDSEGEKARLSRVLQQVRIVDDVSGGILVGWRKDLAPTVVRRKGLAEATLSAPSLIDAVDVPYSANANWAVTASMQRVPEGVHRYAAHIRCLAPPGSGPRGPAHVKFGCALPSSVEEVSLLFSTVGEEDFNPMHFYAPTEGKATLLSLLVEQVAADLLLHPSRTFAFVGLESLPGRIYDAQFGDEDVAENFLERLLEQIECNADAEETERILERVKIMTKESYRAQVGEERFALEAGWNGVAGAPRVL
ncbi:hypothetical protein A1Q2_02643 [Trichosporon asahii var. asahii CBS 8904]|uniref:Uncharacterized protein n=1 Tax=Trichosporon asahii var. asahii (strain CBS 8904) TaxID=1220162 RepID=K1VR00_TRIAC|nr:hypothetical protein A1Q2_02643 [Trichosporon asahii var. asahii CBS 8904]